MNSIEINEVVLVNPQDEEIGKMDKLEAHMKGLLHRAFSIFIFNDKGELLLQKRALGKYHSEDLWTNTCCSHPSPNESIESAGIRRLKEEMGFSCKLKKIFSFIYCVQLDNGLIEHELDHVLIGNYNENPLLNQLEASDFVWQSLDFIKSDIELNPSVYTSWFKIIMNDHFEILKKSLNESL